MATGYDVSALGAYTKDNAQQLLYKQIAQGKTASLMTVQTGIKTSERINIVATTPVPQAQACSFTASANTVFTQRTITVAAIGNYLKWCEKDLEAKYTQLAVKAGSNLDMLTYETEIIGDIMQKMAYNQEYAIWMGDTLSTDQRLIHYDGLVKLIGAASGVTTVTPGAWSVANSRTRLQEFYAALTDDMLHQPTGKVFMGTAECRDYRMKLGIDNLYHNTGTDGVLRLENSDLEIIPTLGLSGTKKIYFIPTETMILGTDLENEFEKFELFYAKEAREIRFIAEHKEGVQISQPILVAQMLNT